MSNPGWHFKRRERSDEVADPIQAEFFDEASDPDERRLFHDDARRRKGSET